MEESLSPELLKKCKMRLLKIREERMNGLNALKSALESVVTGDEGDMSSVLEAQHTAITQREKIIMELREIDLALRRIEEGEYGICEETGELIEEKRLLAIPWTRLSLRGAELRELQRKRFA
jgi:DnaK suppressor protein